jgi:glutaredoxin-dependent peroxiredoxin
MAFDPPAHRVKRAVPSHSRHFSSTTYQIFIPMALPVGTAAPAFKLTTIGANGPEYVSLADSAGKENVVLLFVPMAFTGGCTKELCEISAGLNEYAALGARVIAISGDNPFAQKAWAEKENISVTLLSDYDHQVTAAYEIGYDSFLPEKNLGQAGVPKRSAFVVDKAGTIRYSEANDNPGTMPNFAAIKECLTGLK